MINKKNRLLKILYYQHYKDQQRQNNMVRRKRKKRKTGVNAAGNYTKPTMRKRLYNKITAGRKGGRAGQWSARKAQMLARQYKAKGGGYKN